MTDAVSTEAMVLVSDRGVVRTLTLNRPATLNSFTAAMHEQLLPALDAAAADAAVRAVVLTGAGRGFCAGQDLRDPAMAANLALCCDLVVAARSASFIQAFSKIGLVPDCGGTWLLPRLVGRARALGLAMTGDKLPAEDAERIGLIWQCVDDVLLVATVAALADRLAAMPSRALAETRRALDAAMPMDLGDALALEAAAQRRLGAAHDFAEGVAAFFAKRPAVFRDR